MAWVAKTISVGPDGIRPMIFVTVGTTMPFDELLAEVDRLAARAFFGENVICQGGQSAYRLSHGEQFVGKQNIIDLINECSLVITHGGLTVIECLIARKPFVAFANPRAAGNHQAGFLQGVSSICDISWSSDVGQLADLFAQRRLKGPTEMRPNFVRAADVIRGLV